MLEVEPQNAEADFNSGMIYLRIKMQLELVPVSGGSLS